MSAAELATKELAEYRRMKEVEALKMSVLDAEAAAKFSTAAALEARDALALPAAVVAGKLLSAKEEEGASAGVHDGIRRGSADEEDKGKNAFMTGSLTGMQHAQHAPSFGGSGLQQAGLI